MFKLASANHVRPVLLFAVFALAVGLRFWGLGWGMPDRIDLHPDEHDYVVGHALEVAHNVNLVMKGAEPFTIKTLDPMFLNYPSFLIYLTALIYGLLHQLGILVAQWQAYVVGRAISACFGAATVLAAMLMAREAGANKTGQLLAALWMALLPLNVWESHVAVTDVTMTFWVACTLWASMRLVRTGRWRDYVMAGAFLGLSVGSKYTAAMTVVAVVAGVFLSGRPMKNTIPGLAAAAAVAVAACFVVTPYSFIRLGDVLKAMAYEHHHTTGHHFGFCLPAKGPQYHRYLYQVVAAWPFCLGIALYAAAVAGTIWGALRLNRARAVLLVFGAVFFGVTGHWNFVPLRYYLPLLTVAVVFAGMWLGAWLEADSAWRRRLGGAAMLVTLVYTLVFTFQTTGRFEDDTRMQAGRWLDETCRPGTSLLTCGWERYMGMPGNERAVKVRRGDEKSFWPELERRRFDVIEISSLHYDRHYRHDNRTYAKKYDALRDPAGPFRLAAKFESSFINRDVYGRLDPMFRGYFVSPTLEFYEPKRP
ncbi:MAG: glycosyltransferase family 39 protein [bacterium]